MLTQALYRRGMDLSEGHWFHTDYYWKKEITGSRMWDVVMEEPVPIYCLCAVKYWPKFWPPQCYKQHKSWKRQASRCPESPLGLESTAVPKEIWFPSLALFGHFAMFSLQKWSSFFIYLIVVRWNWFVLAGNYKDSPDVLMNTFMWSVTKPKSLCISNQVQVYKSKINTSKTHCKQKKH